MKSGEVELGREYAFKVGVHLRDLQREVDRVGLPIHVTAEDHDMPEIADECKAVAGRSGI
jgi:hypothetical protein